MKLSNISQCRTVKDAGTSLVEYGLLLMLISLVTYGTVRSSGASVMGRFECAAEGFNNTGSCSVSASAPSWTPGGGMAPEARDDL